MDDETLTVELLQQTNASNSTVDVNVDQLQSNEYISMDDISSFEGVNLLAKLILSWHNKDKKSKQRTLIESLIAITIAIMMNVEYAYVIVSSDQGSFASQQHFWSAIIVGSVFNFLIARCIQQYIFATKFPYPWMVKDITQNEYLTENEIKFVKKAIFWTKAYFLMSFVSCMGTLVLDIELSTSLFQSKSWFYIVGTIIFFIVQTWSSLLPSIIAFIAMIVIVVKYTVKLKQMINLVNEMKNGIGIRNIRNMTNIVSVNVELEQDTNVNVNTQDMYKQVEFCKYSLSDICRMFSVIESDWKRDWDCKKNHWQCLLLFYAIGCILDLWMIVGIILTALSYNYNDDDDDDTNERDEEWIKSEPFHYFYTIYFVFLLMLFILPFALLLYFGGYMTHTFDKFQNELADLLIASDGYDLSANDKVAIGDNSHSMPSVSTMPMQWLNSNNYYRLHLKIQRTSVYFTIFGVKVSFFVAIQSVAAFIVAKLLVFAYDAIS